MNRAQAIETVRLIGESLYERIPTGEATELIPGYGSLLWKLESGFDLPPEFQNTVPVEDE